jgi:hypothetical protein
MPRPCNCSNSSCNNCSHIDVCTFYESLDICCTNTLKEATEGDNLNFFSDMKKQLAKYCRFYDVKK